MIKFKFKADKISRKITCMHLETKGNVAELASESSVMLMLIHNELMERDPKLAQVYKELIEHGIATELTWRPLGKDGDDN